MVSLGEKVTKTAKITKVCGLHSAEENAKCHWEVSENRDVIFQFKLINP